MVDLFLVDTLHVKLEFSCQIPDLLTIKPKHETLQLRTPWSGFSYFSFDEQFVFGKEKVVHKIVSFFSRPPTLSWILFSCNIERESHIWFVSQTTQIFGQEPIFVLFLHQCDGNFVWNLLLILRLRQNLSCFVSFSDYMTWTMGLLFLYCLIQLCLSRQMSSKSHRV